MEQLDFFNVPSPCIARCQANNKGYCKGCFRSREERFHWARYNGQEKREVIRLTSLRRQRVLREKQKKQAQKTQDKEISLQGDLFDDNGLYE